MPRKVIFLLIFAAWCRIHAATAPPLLPPDPRYKADLLLIVAHPDDDVVIGGYLARASLDQHKRIAVIYCTPGDGGGNAVGNEAGAALGQMRIIEARRALASFGIENVWFLPGHDTPGQDVLRSLDRWGHGHMLEAVVRLVRLTRPDVILTWLPDYVVGENHGDHQAAGVLATEAFDLAGDPTQFAEQVSPARNRTGMANLTEGLRPWQASKLYFATDAFEDFGPYWHDSADLSPFRKNFLDGRGPAYSNTEISPARRKSYARLNAEQQLFYLTQEGDLATQAFAANDLRTFEFPMRLIFGKSVVGGSVTGDVFEDVGQQPSRQAQRVSPDARGRGVQIEIGGPWAYYAGFWKEHGLDHLSDLIPVPEVSVGFGRMLSLPLFLRNNTGAEVTVKVSSKLPPGWTDRTPYAGYPVRSGEAYPLRVEAVAPAAGKDQWQELAWTAQVNGQDIGVIRVRALVKKSGGMTE